MDTPDVTKEDGVGILTIISAVTYGSQSDSELVQLASVIVAGLLGISIVLAGAWRRGKRAEFLTGGEVE